MDAMIPVRNFLLDRIGHLTFPGQPEFDPVKKHWRVPIQFRSAGDVMVIGEAIVDDAGQLIRVPTRDELLARLPSGKLAATAPLATTAD